MEIDAGEFVPTHVLCHGDRNELLVLRDIVKDALAIVVKEIDLAPARASSTVRQGGIHQEILEEANAINADLIVMSLHRPQKHAVRTYFLGELSRSQIAAMGENCRRISAALKLADRASKAGGA